ncbi:MAG TPA: DNA replication/repair protein RecF [Ktedonobacterales bacterium]|nr:DNA replication/repair protein RecF [Ktedonobacterales bacterium]
MYVERLRLTDFRNYRALDLALPRGLVVFSGRNAQGKSNVLEAVTLAATSRSFRTSSDREVVRWGAPGRFARVEANIARHEGPLHVELVVSDIAPPQEGTPTAGRSEQPSRAGSLSPPPAPFRKRIKVNGTPRRAMDLLGQATVVVFAPTDLEIVTGTPAERRRFLDVTLCQVHPAYCRTLSQYQKVLTQRAALLRRIRDGEDEPHALGYWDEQLARLAVPIMRARAEFLRRAEADAARIYAELARGEAENAEYADEMSDADASLASEDAPAEPEPNALPLRLVYRPSLSAELPEDEAAAQAAFRAGLAAVRRRELAQGVNAVGPHRDDMAFLAGEMDLAIYGSRGQQRSAALALKLAELRYIERETGDQPILLLDDVLSELDARRRADLLDAVAALDQVLLTTTDATALPESARAHATLFDVRGGRVVRATP